MTARAPTRGQWLAERPLTLMLSAGFFGFFSHTGFMQALESEGIRPDRIVGCSAGALVGGLWASGVAADTLADELIALRRADFWDPGVPLGGWLKGHKFNATLRRVLAHSGVERIEHCPVAFSSIVYDVVRRRSMVLTQGRLDLAIQASCTVPLMFRPLWVGGRLLVDGGVADRVGLSAVEPGHRVLVHYLQSRLGRRRGRQAAPSSIRGQRWVVTTPRLPRISPFHLEQGPAAIEVTRDHMVRWLRAPMVMPPAN